MTVRRSGSDEPAKDALQMVSPLRAWLAVAVLFLFYVLSILDRGVLSLMVSPIMRELNISAVQFGLLQGFAFAIVYSLAGLPLGLAVDRLARRRLLISGVLVWSSGTTVCALATEFASMAAGRALVGLGEAVLIPTALSLIADMFPREKLGSPTAVFSSGATLGAGASLVMGGWLMSYFDANGAPGVLSGMSSWRAVLLLAGAFGLCAAWLGCLVPDRRRAAPRDSSGEAMPASSRIGFGRFLLLHAGLLACTFISFPLLITALAALIWWAPYLFEQSFGWTGGRAGLVIGTMQMVVSPLGTIFGGYLVDKATRMRIAAPYFVVPILSAVMGIPLIAAGVLQSSPVVAIALLSVGLFIFCGFAGSQFVLIQLISPPHLRGRVSALFLMALSLLGTGLGSVLPPFMNLLAGEDGPRGFARALAMTVVGSSTVATFALVLGRSRLRIALGNAH